jgi:hypothetical protein
VALAVSENQQNVQVRVIQGRNSLAMCLLIPNPIYYIHVRYIESYLD